MKNATKFLIFSILFFSIACNNSNNKQNQNGLQTNKNSEGQLKTEKVIEEATEEEIKNYELSNRLETYIINKDSIPPNSIMNYADSVCAVFKSPNSKQIKRLKKEYGEEDFYVVADDNNYYHYEARTFLDSMKIKTIDVFDSRYVMHVNLENDTIYLDLEAKNSHPWNLIFFRSGKPIKIVDIVDIENEYISYFE